MVVIFAVLTVLFNGSFNGNFNGTVDGDRFHHMLIVFLVDLLICSSMYEKLLC